MLTCEQILTTSGYRNQIFFQTDGDRLLSIGYSTIEIKEVARIGYNRFLFPHEYSGEGRGA